VRDAIRFCLEHTLVHAESVEQSRFARGR
jgi:hypothetical protein